MRGKRKAGRHADPTRIMFSTLIRILVVSALFASAMAGVSLAQVTSEDRKEMMALLERLSDHLIKPSDALDPSLDEKQREQSLSYFSTLNYQLSLQPTGEIVSEGSDSATVPVRVELRAENRGLQANGSVSFVKRSGIWYLANYDFLSTPPIIIVVIVISVAIGIAYSSTILVLVRRLLRSGELDLGTWTRFSFRSFGQVFSARPRQADSDDQSYLMVRFSPSRSRVA